MNMKVCMVADNAVDYVFSLMPSLARYGLRIELLGGDDTQKIHPLPEKS
jgi:hypothetical protein